MPSTGRNITTMNLSTYLFVPGAGLVSSRTGWATTDTQFLAQAGSTLQSHQDRDAGTFALFRSDWLCPHAKLMSQSGIAQDCWDANCCSFQGPAGPQSQAWTQDGVKILAQEDVPNYSFISANLAAAYLNQVTTYTRSYLFLKGANSQYLLVK